ncbi:MAG: hypothetical protein VX777_07505 [Chlamydiota bacterium]|nr:hypothetical protein [Chlamydiota bacterium]
MDRWLIYCEERFPLLNYLAIIAGLSFSGLVIRHGAPSFAPFLFSMIGLFLIFFLYRIMDDTKDYEVDILAHPDRPLPKVLFAVDEFKVAINLLQIAMFVFAMITWMLFSKIAGMTYLIIAVYLWHMYREFYIDHWISKKPITYGLTHLIIIVLITLFPVSLTRPELILTFSFLSYGFMIFAAFFTYDICRKLDEHAHPTLKTYLQYHGFNKIFILCVFTLIISAVGAKVTSMQILLWPIELVVLLSLCIVYFDRTKWGIAQGAATASVFIHVWAGTFFYIKSMLG